MSWYWRGWGGGGGGGSGGTEFGGGGGGSTGDITDVIVHLYNLNIYDLDCWVGGGGGGGQHCHLRYHRCQSAP